MDRAPPVARMAASGLGASAALLAISHNGDDTAGDAAAGVADWLGEVVVWLVVDDKRRAVGIEQSRQVAAGNRNPRGEELSRRCRDHRDGAVGQLVGVDMAGGRLEVGRTGAGGVQVNAVRHLPFRPSQIVVRAGFGVVDLIPPATSPFRGVGPSLPGYSPEARFNSATSVFNSATSACSVCRSVA